MDHQERRDHLDYWVEEDKKEKTEHLVSTELLELQVLRVLLVSLV